MSLRALAATAVVMAVCGCNPAGSAQQSLAGPSSAPVIVRVRMIEGVPAAQPSLDPALADLSGALRQHRTFRFVQLADTTSSLAVGGFPARIVAAAGNVDVHVLGVTPEAAQLRVVLEQASVTKLDTTLRTGPNKVFFLAGPTSPVGSVVFLAVEAQYGVLRSALEQPRGRPLLTRCPGRERCADEHARTAAGWGRVGREPGSTRPARPNAPLRAATASRRGCHLHYWRQLLLPPSASSPA